MADVIAIFERPDGMHYIAFLIDGKWWPVTDYRYNISLWTSEVEARSYLGLAYDGYLSKYGERLSWNVASVPVYHLERKDPLPAEGASYGQKSVNRPEHAHERARR